MNNIIEVVQPGLLTSMQDVGRTGLAFYAIPASGPLDRRSAQTANILVGNDDSATVLECNFTPPRLRFERAATIGLTGADMQWQIDGSPVARYRTLDIRDGGVLSGSPSRDGSRGYIAMAGRIETTQSFNSTACYPLAELGGNHGRALRTGDVVYVHAAEVRCRVELSLPRIATSPVSIDFVPGPEFDALIPESQVTLVSSSFRITPESNRMGARMQGPALRSKVGLLDSVPVLPGMVQLLPSGGCIVVLQDGQTTGGYPRIAYIPGQSLDRFTQLRTHEPFYLRCIG